MPELSKSFVKKYINNHKKEILEEIERVCSIGAPTFKEKNRLSYIKKTLDKENLVTRIDSIGNLLVPINGQSKKFILIDAHVDSVHKGKKVAVKKRFNRMTAPGIGDNAVSIGSLIFLIKFFKKISSKLKYGLLASFTVREEGKGNLEGIREVIKKNKKRIKFAIIMEGGQLGDIGNIFPANYRIAVKYKKDVKAIKEKVRKINWGDVLILKNKQNFIVDILFMDKLKNRANQLRKILKNIRFQQITSKPYGLTRKDNVLIKKVLIIHKRIGINSSFISRACNGNIPSYYSIPTVYLGINHVKNPHTEIETINTDLLEKGILQILLLLAELNKDKR